MKRRTFVRRAGSAALLATGPLGLGIRPSLSTKWDRYGGSPRVKGEKTGYFHLENINGRWWLISPEGNSFLSFGINHIYPELMKRDENRNFWEKRLGVADLEDKVEFYPALEKKVAADMEAFGFNVFGCHTPTEYYTNLRFPYVKQILFAPICHFRSLTEESFADVFSPDFARMCDTMAKVICHPLRDDPYLIGYKFANCPVWREEESRAREVVMYGGPRKETPTWPRVLRNLPPEAPGKRAYVGFMQKRYDKNISHFNQVYTTSFSSFEELRNATDWRKEADTDNQAELQDLDSFLLTVLEQYYEVICGAIRKYDRQHMILGDKINGNTQTPVEIVRLTAKYSDLIYYQWYGLYDEQKPRLDAWSAATQVPLYNADSCYSTPSERMPHPNGPHCASQEQRAQVSAAFARQAFARPDFVGWDHCGWMDSWNTAPKQQDRQHSGLQDPFGNYHEPMRKAFRQFSDEKYRIVGG
ncbi:hypothetical protein [Tunicatimonas pelagia]|uniref:hypothetical protein n=1 Tax=Tunicatimonas pelagia TaxID=931531 RepID=UPI002666DEE4|nr:hypothetical protein [Tunicatimonas pelagia]WKN44980.1 hypothetical protein P0M28_08385 [Tunicatimonas pelagia]